MKRHIPKEHLLAFARECLKMERLLSEQGDLAELRKFLNLLRSMEKSGGISALEALLRPDETASTAWDAVCSVAKEACPPLKDTTLSPPTTDTKRS
jgi:hypothetical protein